MTTAKTSSTLKDSNPESHISQLPRPEHVGIIGGGVASLLLADALLKKDPQLQVTLFCKDGVLAKQGSSNKQGAIYPLLQDGQSRLARFYSAAFEYAVDYYQSRVPSHTAASFHQSGVLQQAFNQTMPDKFKSIVELWPNIVEFVNAHESSDIANLPLPFPSLYFKNAGWLNPKALTEYLAEDLNKTNRLNIVYQCEIVSIRKQQKQWVVNSCDQTFSVDRVVNCAGVDAVNVDLHTSLETQADITRLKSVNVVSFPIDGVRGQVSSFNSNSPVNKLKCVICHKGYITPSDGEFQTFGATFEKSWSGNEPTSAAQTKNIEQIKKIYETEQWPTSLSSNLVNHDNIAIRATTSDHLPIAGELHDWNWLSHYVDNNNGNYRRADKIKGEVHNSLAGYYSLTGLGARGLTSGPLLADLVSDLVLYSKPKSQILQTLLPIVAPIRFQIRAFKRHKGIPR